jgi:transposase
MAKDTIGIDVSKDRLDAFWHSQDAALSLPNTVEGFAQLCTWLGKNKGVLVVFEATGAYHRGLERYLSLAGQPFIKVNPKQARRFAQAIGRLAKTDSVDARMLARMGVVLDLAPQGIEGEDVHDLRELLTARRAMVKDQITAKTRLATASNPLVKDQLCRRIDDIDTDIKALDQVIAQIAQQRGTLDERIRRLMTIPGIGRLTATTLVIDMPELGHLDSKKIAALAGLAPMTQQSGKWQGKERIIGGRASLRRAIYMPALVAIRFNHDFRDKYQQFVNAGKAKKVAITAVMRRIIVLANTLLREGRDWQPVRPDQDGYSTAARNDDVVHRRPSWVSSRSAIWRSPSSHEHARRLVDPQAPARARRDDEIKAQIKRVHEASSGLYGARKVWHQLLRDGVAVARCTVERLMAAMGLAGIRRGKTTITTVSNPKARAHWIKSIASSALNVPTHCGWSILHTSTPGPASFM